MLIAWQNLEKHFNGKIIRYADFQLEEEGVYGVSGPSGCGKTTLARLMMGVIQPSKGELKKKQGLKCSVLFPENRLIASLTAKENVRLVGGDEQQTEALFDQLGLSRASDLYPDELSSGMKRRVAFIRAYVFSGDILILDEPFNGLDQLLRAEVTNLIITYGQKKTVLLIDHHTQLLEKISQSTLYLGGDTRVF